MSIRREIEVTRKGLPRPIDVTFGTNMLPLEFVITDFELPEGTKVEAYAIGVSKKLVKQSCEVSGNVISFTPEIGLFEEGKNILQLAASCDGKDLFSFYIPVICQKTMFYEGAQNLEEDPTFLGMVMQMKQDVGELSEETLPLLRLNGCIVCNGEEITLAVGTDVEVGQVIAFKYKKSKGYSVSARGLSMQDIIKPSVAEDGYREDTFEIKEGFETVKFTGAYFVVVPLGGTYDYDDLTNTPTIPTKTSQLTDDVGFAKKTDVSKLSEQIVDEATIQNMIDTKFNSIVNGNEVAY